MQLFTLKNMMIALVGTGSIVALGTMRDLQTKSVHDSEEEVVMFSEEIERNLASVVQTQGAKSLYVAMNEMNQRRINGEWEIVRHVKDSEVVFDASKGEGSIKAKLELINVSTVKVGNDNEQIFQVSILEGKKIALFKRLGNSYEILEARKIELKVEAQVSNDQEVEMVLERAILQENPGQVLKDSEIQGSVTLKNKELHNLSVSIQTIAGVERNISINFAEIGDAGAFTVDVDGDDVSGMFFNNGNDGYRLSFVNGPLAGAQLNFMTEDKVEARKEQEEQAKYEQSFEEIEETKVVDTAMEEKVIEASSARNQNAEEVEVYSAEEVKQIAETNGFNF
ncbi:MAG: hypothetical protein L6Q33_03470 [Bacteriovoracaceae bacterium]|nr:hypothetical protein [Bacteriovoracaceae bacterium]